MTKLERSALALAAIIAAAVAGVLATAGQGEVPPFTPSPYDAHIFALDKQALDEAYRDQIKHLFEIWMKDERDQPRRAVIGARAARKAYVGAISEIERRERELPAAR